MRPTRPLARRVLTGTAALLVALVTGLGPASADDGNGNGRGNGPGSERGRDREESAAVTEDTDTNDGGTPDDVADDGDNAHPSGRDRSVEDGDGTQGRSSSDPDDDGRGPDRSNGGADKPDGPGGVDPADQDGNNGCGNDDDFEDDNEGWCGRRPQSGSAPAAAQEDRPPSSGHPCEGEMADGDRERCAHVAPAAADSCGQGASCARRAEAAGSARRSDTGRAADGDVAAPSECTGAMSAADGADCEGVRTASCTHPDMLGASSPCAQSFIGDRRPVGTSPRAIEAVTVGGAAVTSRAAKAEAEVLSSGFDADAVLAAQVDGDAAGTGDADDGGLGGVLALTGFGLLALAVVAIGFLAAGEVARRRDAARG